MNYSKPEVKTLGQAKRSSRALIKRFRRAKSIPSARFSSPRTTWMSSPDQTRLPVVAAAGR